MLMAVAMGSSSSGNGSSCSSNIASSSHTIGGDTNVESIRGYNVVSADKKILQLTYGKIYLILTI